MSEVKKSDMPKRILSDSIRESEDIDSLSYFEEVFFYRLIVSCDDYGCMDGRPKVLKSTLFPLKDLTTRQVEAALHKLLTAGMVRAYEVQGRPYLQLTGWSRYQRLRDSKHKYPTPEDAQKQPGRPDEFSPQVAASCGELRRTAASCGKSRPELEPETESESEPEPFFRAERSGGPDAPLVVDCAAIILNTGEEWRPTVELYEEYVRLYPNVDVLDALAKMRAWCISNPSKRKTINGVKRFVNGWLSRNQDNSRAHSGSSAPGSAYMDAIKNRVNDVDGWLERRKGHDGEGVCDPSKDHEGGVCRP